MKISFYYIKEINYRLVYSFWALLLNFSVIYTYKQSFIYILLPKGLSHFISSNLTEIFILYVQMTLILSLSLGIITFLNQIYLFLRPGLYEYEEKFLSRYLSGLIFLYLSLYLLTFPFIIQLSWNLFYTYTENFNPINLSFELRLDDYLIYLYQIALSMAFNIFLFFILIIGLKRKKQRKMFYFFIIIFTSLISPPDLYTQVVISLPVILIYELQNFINVVYLNYFSLIRQPIKTI